MFTYKIGIKTGALSGVISGIIFSIIVVLLFYSLTTTPPNSSEHLQISNKLLINYMGFSKYIENISTKDAMVSLITSTLGGSILAGILLGISTSALISITRRGPSYSITILTLITLLAYFSQTYEKLTGISHIVHDLPFLDTNIFILLVSTYLMPPLLFASIEGMFLNYFWGMYTVVKFMPHAPVKKEQQKSAVIIAAPATALPAPPPPSSPSPFPPPPLSEHQKVLQKIISQDLKNYVFQCIDKGISEEEIKSMFLSYGYDPKAIDEVLQEKRSTYF